MSLLERFMGLLSRSPIAVTGATPNQDHDRPRVKQTSTDLSDPKFLLTTEDKFAIRMAIVRDGVESIENVTKGEKLLYLRDTMQFFGENELYLRSLFSPDSVPRKPINPFSPEAYAPVSELPCPSSGWPIKEEKISIPLEGSPEQVALTLLSQNGWTGIHSEGQTIRCIFRALLLPYLIEHNPYKAVDPLSTPLCHAIHYLIPMTAAGLDRMLANSKEVPRAPIEEMHRLIDYRLSLPSCVIQGDFDIVAKSHGEVWPKTPHSGLHIDQYLSAIPGEFWHSLLEIYARQDGSLSNGWPDLEITNGKEVMLVEVKVKDRLTPHQRLTIPVLMALGLKCRIVRLIKT